MGPTRWWVCAYFTSNPCLQVRSQIVSCLTVYMYICVCETVCMERVDTGSPPCMYVYDCSLTWCLAGSLSSQTPTGIFVSCSTPTFSRSCLTAMNRRLYRPEIPTTVMTSIITLYQAIIRLANFRGSDDELSMHGVSESRVLRYEHLFMKQTVALSE